MTLEIQPAPVAALQTTAIPAPAMAVTAETFWERMDRYGSYVFAVLFLCVGVGLPLVAMVHSIVNLFLP